MQSKPRTIVRAAVGLAMVAALGGGTMTVAGASVNGAGRVVPHSGSGNGSTSVTTTTLGNVSVGHGNTSVLLWDGISGSNEPSFLSWLKSTSAPIKLDAQELPWPVVYEKLPAAMASGQPPQLLMLHPYDLEPYAEHGDLLTLNSFVDSFVPQTTRDDTVWKANAVDGKQFAVPVGVWDLVFIYNETLWKKAGYPSGPPLDNPSELMAALKKLTIGSGSSVSQWGLGVQDDTNDLGNMYEMLMMQEGLPLFGKSSVHITSAKSLKVLQYMSNLVNTEHVEAPPSGLNPQALFEQGKLALWLTGQWNLEGLEAFTAGGGKVKWSIASKPVLMMPGGKEVGLQGGPALAITKATGDSSSTQLRAEEAFIKWAYETEAHWVKGGGLLPVALSSSEVQLLKHGSAVNYSAYQQLADSLAETTNPDYDAIDSTVLLPMLEKVDTAGSNVKALAAAAQSASANA